MLNTTGATASTTVVDIPLCINSPEKAKKFIDSTDTFLFDCDGVLWHDYVNLIPGVSEALLLLHSLKKRCIFVTNNSLVSRSNMVHHFHKLGFTFVTLDDIFNSSYAAALFLKDFVKVPSHKKVFVVGNSGISDELSLQGISSVLSPDRTLESLEEDVASMTGNLEEVGAVVVGVDYHFNYYKLAMANAYLRNQDDKGEYTCAFIATNTDNSYVSRHGIYPGTGSIVAAVENACERNPVVMGKPSQRFLDCIREAVKFDPMKTCMVGDRLDTDIQFGLNGSLSTLLVLSGVTSSKTLAMAPKDQQPKYFAMSFGEVGHLYNLN